MKMLTSLLDKLYKAQARMFKPVAEKDLRALRIAMAKEKMQIMTEDYWLIPIQVYLKLIKDLDS